MQTNKEDKSTEAPASMHAAPSGDKNQSVDNENKDISEDEESEISKEELKLLDEAGDEQKNSDDDKLESASLDDTDEDGDALNESGKQSGIDLDVPGSEDDDDNEDIGEEDEENNSYSREKQNDE